MNFRFALDHQSLKGLLSDIVDAGRIVVLVRA